MSYLVVRQSSWSGLLLLAATESVNILQYGRRDVFKRIEASAEYNTETWFLKHLN